MNPSQSTIERAQALRQRTRPRSFYRPPASQEGGFPIVLRGYDRAAVDEYVSELNRLINELRSSRSSQAAVKEALDRVGEETSTILQRAHETADEIRSVAEIEASRRLEAADRDAQSLRAQAEREARELADDSDTVWHERTTMLDDMRRLAESLLEAADTASERITQSPAEAVRAFAAGEDEPAPAPESDPDDSPAAAADREPHVWRGPRSIDRPTEQMDALPLEEDDELEDPDSPPDPAVGGYRIGVPPPPYES